MRWSCPIIRSTRPYRDEALRRGLAVAEATGFISMSRKGDEAQLAGIKAVSEGYPLRGKLRVGVEAGGADEEARGIPPRGAVWVDERLPAALNAKVGDRIELGEAGFVVDRILTLEPDRGVTFFNIAPRLLMNVADVPATRTDPAGQPRDATRCSSPASASASMRSRHGPSRVSGAARRCRAWRTRAPRSAPRSTARSSSSASPRCSR